MDRREAILSISTVLGYSIAPASIISLSTSCSEKEAGWQPAFFAKEDANLIEQLGETFLPRTDTPGSIDVSAHIFVDGFLSEVAKSPDQDKARQGLERWKSDYNSRTGKNLSKASAEALQDELSVLFGVASERQQEIKSMLEGSDPGGDASTQYHIYGFLLLFKRLIMMGYYASEQVGENVLSYLPVPGRYEACIPAEEVGNVWAL